MRYEIKGAPIRYRGSINVEKCSTSAEVMKVADLAWKVAKCEIVAKMPAKEDPLIMAGFVRDDSNYVECTNAYAVYRTDINIPLGLVKERYTPVQNIDAFSFFDNAIGKDKAIWQTAGYFGNGERIFVSAKLPRNILVDGDPVENYLVFTNSHDGTSGVKILFTPIRVICENTLNAAIKESSNYVSFRHTKSVYEKIDIAAEILGICDTKIKFLNESYNAMKKIKFNDNEARNLFADVILTEEEQRRVKETGHTIEQIAMRDWMAINDSQISMKKVNTLAEMNNYYFMGPGQRGILGTGWGVYNAVSGYYSNISNGEGIKRMDSLLYGSKSNKIELAGNLILAA